MKLKVLLFTLLLLFSLKNEAQTPFDKYDTQDNVTSVIVTSKMFELMGKVKMESKEDQAYLDLIKKLSLLKVYKTSNSKISNELVFAAQNYSAGLDEIAKINENGKISRIFVRPIAGTDSVSELLLFMTGKETIVMLLKGSFSVSEIALLTKKMNLPVTDDLNKAVKK